MFFPRFDLTPSEQDGVDLNATPTAVATATSFPGSVVEFPPRGERCQAVIQMNGSKDAVRTVVRNVVVERIIGVSDSNCTDLPCDEFEGDWAVHVTQLF